MKKLSAILAVITLMALVGTITFSLTAKATDEINLIPSTVGTFESDTLPTQWDKRSSSTTLEVSTEQYHSGTRSMKQSGRTADSTAPRLYIYDYISTNGAGVYHVSMWAYIDGLTAQASVHMGLRCDAGAYSFLNATARAELVTAPAQNKTWVQLSGEFIVTEADLTLAASQTDPSKSWGLCLISGVGATTVIYMDDVTLSKASVNTPSATATETPTQIPTAIPTATTAATAATTPTAAPTAAPVKGANLIPGTVGTFESNTLPTQWDKRSGVTTLEVSTEQHHGGTRSMKHSGRTADTTAPRLYIYDYIAANGPGDYRVSMWVYIDGLASPATTNIGIRCDAGAYSFLNATARVELGSTTVNNKIWVQLAGEFTVTKEDLALAATQADPAKAWGLCLTSGVGATTMLYMDDITLNEVVDDTASGGVQGFRYTVEGNNDIGTNGIANLYLLNMVGHYDTASDTATLFVQNTSGKALTFQLCVGYAWDGDGEEKTSAIGEKVTLESGKAGKLTATHVSQYYKKTGTGTYDETQKLNGDSVVRLNIWDAKAGDTFVLGGIKEIGAIKGNGATINMQSNLEKVTVSEELANFINGKASQVKTADRGIGGYVLLLLAALALLLARKKACFLHE